MGAKMRVGRHNFRLAMAVMAVEACDVEEDEVEVFCLRVSRS